MKTITLILIALMLTVSSCIDCTFEQKKNTMIKSMPYNAVNFSSDFTRESKYFDPKLQRVVNVISPLEGAYLSFEYTPETMPDPVPVATLYFLKKDGSVSYSRPAAQTVELTDRIIYFAELNVIPSDADYMYFKIADIADTIYSEKIIVIEAADLNTENVIAITAYNNDDLHGYISTYPACGFFRVSELNGKIFGNEKVEYNYSYGRKLILSSENYIKTRFTFVGLSMYQQNLLKWLCNCQNLTINGVAYQLISDFTEKNKDENNEICDLQADFVEAEHSIPIVGATEMPTDIAPTNLFLR